MATSVAISMRSSSSQAVDQRAFKGAERKLMSMTRPTSFRDTCSRQVVVFSNGSCLSGYLYSEDCEHLASHAWAEAWVEDLGWVGFDPANGVCPHERYVRIAAGLDSLGASPIRGTSFGGGPGLLSVKLSVRPVQQPQQQ